ncbi:Na+/H+ antiporter subunit E [Nocardiopsis rhodophaea]|uniref:Na+/H+ antiporter subunit E n=1 Tax=Nocardiopsis rhodophaea TaxID=280238 RepID=A0ABN2TD66_9ACTN
MTPQLAHDDPAAAGPRWRRILGRLPTVAWLTVMWMLLWGDASPGTALAGIGVAMICYSVAKLPHIPVRLSFRPLSVLRLVGHFVFDLIVSSVHVASRVLWRPREANGAIVAVPVRTDSDLLLAMVSGGLSLITGSLVIELNRDEGVIFVHGMPIGTPDDAERLRRRVRRTEELFVRAFGTADDITAFEAAEGEAPRA